MKGFESMTGPEFRAYLIRTGKLVPSKRGPVEAEMRTVYDDALDRRPCLPIGRVLRAYAHERPAGAEYQGEAA